MGKPVFETISYIMRYWFIFLTLLILAYMFLISIRDYRNKRNLMSDLGRFMGYLEVTDAEEDIVGIRVGITEDNLIGSGSSADIVINAEGIEKKHARLFENDGVFYLESYASTPMKVNGKVYSSQAPVKNGDYIEIGSIELYLFLRSGDYAE